MKIEISQEEYEFLKDLKNELNTQTTDGNAQPVYWGVRETVEECRGSDGDFGGEPCIVFDDGHWTLDEAVEAIEERFNCDVGDYSDEVRNKWEKEVDKKDPDEIYDFMRNDLKWDWVYHVAYVEKVKRVIEDIGAFLTKRACQNYIDKYGYNHNEPQTYAMTAYRNFELEKLLKILRNLKFEDND